MVADDCFVWFASFRKEYVYYFLPDLKQNLERNKARSGKARVPDIAIFAARKRLEVPEKSEGFACIYRVSIAEDQQFSIHIEND